MSFAVQLRQQTRICAHHGAYPGNRAISSLNPSHQRHFRTHFRNCDNRSNRRTHSGNNCAYDGTGTYHRTHHGFPKAYGYCQAHHKTYNGNLCTHP